ncbi:MAG TPA: 16S rRNA (uracil(1498)-N(3))-methyltransferase [Steroidobacteraceae bacterium]|nr:16S rRNA (uracil(1498)-N(3))-methyltransferase [Steroidobacteraceae bacterium]
MRLTRVYIEEPLARDSRVRLAGAAVKHVKRVLRLEPGDELTLFDGRGGEYAARLEGFAQDAVLLAVGPQRAVERESPLAVTLAQGISRGERMDLVVQKATELGVASIAPLVTERTVVRLDGGQAQMRVRHWRAIAIAACEQCGRNTLPELTAPQTLAGFLADSRPEGARLVLSPGGSLRTADLEPSRRVTLLIGPEGGLAEQELEAAVAAGFRTLRLGPRVLRTETAAIAALAAIQLKLGDL